MAADVVMHADVDDGLEEVFFDQKLNDVLGDDLLGLGAGGLCFAEENVVQDGLRVNVVILTVERKCIRQVPGNVRAEPGAAFKQQALHILGEPHHFVNPRSEAQR